MSLGSLTVLGVLLCWSYLLTFALSCTVCACMLYYCNMVRWAWWDWELTTLFSSFDTAGWIIWPVKYVVSKMTYSLFGCWTFLSQLLTNSWWQSVLHAGCSNWHIVAIAGNWYSIDLTCDYTLRSQSLLYWSVNPTLLYCTLLNRRHWVGIFIYRYYCCCCTGILLFLSAFSFRLRVVIFIFLFLFCTV